MKIIVIFFWGIVSSISLNGQSVPATGRILYEQLSNGRVQYIEMWFSGQYYKYSTRNRPDDFIKRSGSYPSVADSLREVEENKKIAMLINEGQPDQIWYGNLENNIVLNSISLIDEQVTTADTLSFVSWEISDDTATVDGILCQKAMGTTPKGSKLDAWFAPSIPIASAPFTLRGLPGLMIQVNYQNRSVITRTLELDFPLKENITIEMPDKSSVISKNELKYRIDKHNEEAMRLLEYYKKQGNQEKKLN